MDINILDLIQAELAIIIAVTYVLGMFLKQTPRIPDWSIPLLLLAFSIVVVIVYKAIVLDEAFTAVTIINGFLYGVLVAGVCVFGNQVIKQVRERA